jgi:hypothetical protein
MINRKADGNITKLRLNDAAIEAGLIHVNENRITAKKRANEEYNGLNVFK